MKTISFILAFLMIAMASLIIVSSSCKKEDSTSEETLKIGVLLGFSGVGSQNAVETKAALEICLEDIADYIDRNDLDIDVELLIEDTQSDTTLAKTKMQSLVDRGARLIIGPYTSTEALAIKSIADNGNVLLVSHSAVSTALAIPGDNFLRFAPSDQYQAEALNAMLESDSIKGIVAVVRNDLWSNSLMEAVDDVYTANGGNVISFIPFEPETTDFSAVVNDVKSALATGVAAYGADKTGLYFVSYGDGTELLNALSNGGLATQHKIYGASAYAQNATLTSDPVAAAFARDGEMQCPVFGFDESAANTYEPIQQRLENVIGTKASIYALAAYDILWTAFLTSITQNPDSEFDAFKSHFIEIANSRFGATGRTELDENGDRKHVFYDFWTVEEETTNTYKWVISAKYSTTSKMLIKR
ncbi:MAG: ABC transporter substrate-binding protein [Bacteroidales bacterium]